MSSSVSPASSDRRNRALAAAIFVFALGLRLLGIGWGLPNDLRNQSLHPDEMVVYTNYAYQPNAWLPGNYNYPSLYPVLVRLTGDAVTSAAGVPSPLGVSQARSLEELKDLMTRYSPHMRLVNLCGRVLSCLAGAGTAVLIFFLLARTAGAKAGLLGGVLTAIAPSLVMHSRFQTVDVTAAFFLWASLLFAVRLSQQPSSRDAVLAGMFAGLSAGTKYTGAIALLSIAAALWISKDAGSLKLFAIALAGCIGAFVVTTPGAILQPSQLMFGITSETQHMREGQELTFVATPNGFVYQLGNLFTGIGPLATIIGLAGLAYGAVRKVRWIWVLLPTLLAYFVTIGISEVKFVRYGLPLVPAVACGFGYLVAGATWRPSWRVPALAAGAFALVGVESLLLSGIQPSGIVQYFDPRFGGLWGAGRYTMYMLREDPRDEVARYLKQRPEASVGLVQTPWFWTVPVIRDASFLYTAPEQQHDMLVQAYLATTLDPRVVPPDTGPPPDYVVATSFELQPLERIPRMEARAEIPPVERNAYDRLSRLYETLPMMYDTHQVFGGPAPMVEDLQYVQPQVRLWSGRRISQ